MPLYEFGCDCGVTKDILLPAKECGSKPNCTCGRLMWRKFTPINFTMPQTGRERILGTLNKEDGAENFPGGDRHRKRYSQAMAKGLDPPKQVVGIGF